MYSNNGNGLTRDRENMEPWDRDRYHGTVAVLKIIAKVFPESATTGVSGEFAAEEDNVLAAIGFALHKRITKDPYAK